MAEDKFNEGMRHLQLAEKAVSKSFFKWTPEWEVGASEFNQAATNFKIAKAFEQAREAYMRCSECQSKCNSTYLAGQALENAASMARELKRYDEVASLYEQASAQYISGGNPDKAAAALSAGGKLLSSVNVNKAIELFIQACDLFESESREQFSLETFTSAIGLLVKNQRFEQALQLLERQSIIVRKLDRKNNLYKLTLSRIIVSLAIPDLVAAQTIAQVAQQEDDFFHSDESKGGEELLQAFERGDQEAVAAAVKKPVFIYIDNEIAKLAKTLPSLVGMQSERNLLL